jgi:ATP-dependent Clp protease ATP-binding subunit ClpA
VVVIKDEVGATKIGFEFLEGPATPKPEKIPEKRARPRKPRARRKPPGPKDNGPKDDGPPRGGTVPKVPLVKV